MFAVDHVLESDSLPVAEQIWASFVPMKLAPEQVDPVQQQMRRCGSVKTFKTVAIRDERGEELLYAGMPISDAFKDDQWSAQSAQKVCAWGVISYVISTFGFTSVVHYRHT